MLDRHGVIDLLVNSAAVIVRKAAEDVTEDDWDLIIATQIFAAHSSAAALWDVT